MRPHPRQRRRNRFILLRVRTAIPLTAIKQMKLLDKLLIIVKHRRLFCLFLIVEPLDASFEDFVDGSAPGAMVNDVAVLMAFTQVIIEPLEVLFIGRIVAEADELDAEVAVAGLLAVLFGEGHDGFV